MNTKNIFKSGALMFAMTIILTVVSFAQTTYYVNVQTGLDGNTGLVAIGAAPQGPKATINNAIAAASAGDVIVVDYGNGNVYNEDVVVTKKLTFNISANSGTGTPIVRSWVVNNTNAAGGSALNTVIFAGTIKVINFLDLQAGAVIGASNLTIGGTPLAPITSPFVKRWATGLTTSSTVDSQLNYATPVDFVYDLTAGPVTTGLELAPAANTTAIKSLTTIGANKLTLNENKTDAGVLVTSNLLDLGGYTLTIKGAANTAGGNISNGTLAFAMAANSALTGAVTVPNVTVSGSGFTLTLTNVTTVGNVSVTSGSFATNNLVTAFGDLTNSGTGALNTGTGVVFTVGKVTNTSSGSIVVGATASTINDVANSGSGTITLNGGTTSIASITNSAKGIINSTLVAAVNVAGSVVNSGTLTASTTGQINFSSTAGVTIGGTTTNSVTITTADASISNAGLITFADGPHVLTGLVTNQPNFSGAAGATTTVAFTNNGQIRFGTTTGNLTLTAGLSVAATNNITDGYTSTAANTITGSGNGSVTFALTTGNYLSNGALSNSSVFNRVTKASGRTTAPSLTNNAYIWFPSQTTGTIGIVATPIGAITNTSVSTAADLNGCIFFSGTSGGLYAGAVSTSGADGGVIGIGDCSVSVASITNSRSVAGTHISVGNGPTALVNIAVSGDVTNSGASSIAFNSFNGAGAETFGIGGTLTNSGSGSVALNAAAVLTGAPAISLGGINLSAGTINLDGAGAATKNVVVNGPASFTAGTLKVGTSAARTLQLGGLANAFSTATTRPDFSAANMVNTTLWVRATTTAGVQTLTGAPTATAWYGPVMIDNNNAGSADPGVIITGGNFRVLNNVTFASTKVRIDNVTVFIGGQNAPFQGVGNFTNASGYTITGNGFVSMNGFPTAQTVSGAGVFANFEVDNGAGAAVAGTFKSQFNLTNGAVTGGAAIVFDNGVVYPTIVRNAGTFTVVPTFTSMVNVYYIGLDKGTANELPVAANKLNNLTVATTNGSLAAGKGRVEFLNLAPTVNGTINVFPGQAIYLDGTTVLTMKGAAITLDGDIANQTTANTLVLANPTGTTITGAGVLPEIVIAAKSQMNMINGATGLATGLLGANGVRGVDDVDPGATGSISYVANAGTDTSSLTVKFGTANTTTGTHLLNVTTATGAQFFLGANLLQKGDLAHNAGIVDVGAFTYNHAGVAPSFVGNATVGGAVTRGAGKLLFTGGATLLSVVTATDTIATNVEIALGAAANTFTLNPATAGGLQIAGNFTLTQGTLVLGDGSTARNLELKGSTFTIANNGSVSVGGIGTLKLNATVPPMTMTYSGTPSLNNVQISNSVTLAGTGTQLNVLGALTHDAGVLDFGTRTLSAAGTYARTTGTYAATTGYFVFSGTAFNNGTVADTIPNFRLANTVGVVWGGTGTNPWAYAPLQVTTNIDFSNTAALTHHGLLRVSDKAAVTFVNAGGLDTVATYGGTITLKLANTANQTLPATIWPATPTALVTTLNVANGAFTATLPVTATATSRVVNNNLVLTSGTFATGANTLVYADSLLVNANGGALSGIVSYGNGASVVYAGTSPTGIELPNTLYNLTFTRTTNVTNFTTSISKVITVNGKLNIYNNVTDNSSLSVLGDVTIASEAATYSNASTPSTTFNSNLTFAGAVDQMLTYPVGGISIGGNLTINKTTGANKVTLSGGDLTVGGVVNFVNGLLYTGSTNALVLSNPVGFGAGFTHAVTSGNVSHVVGNVRQTLKIGLINSAGRNEFPVGDAMNYRPATLTFVNDQLATNQTLGIAATAKYNAIAPTGIVGLPIKDGVSTGVDLARYAPFSWSISTNGSLGSTKFDLELTAAGDTSDFNSTNKLVEDARIIRRVGGVGDIANTWFLQGTQYDNFIIGGVPTVTNVNSVGGLLTGGAIFTYGLKSTLVITNAIAPQTLTAGSTAFTRDLNVPAVFGGSTTAFTYTAQSSNTNVATVSLTGSVLKVTPVGAGTAVVTVTGSTTDQGQIQTSFAVTVNPGAVAVSGKVVYDNAATTGIGLATVTLTPATGSAIQVAADTAGNYSFANVASGSYTLSATKAGTWAGANSTDALQVVRAYAGLTTLDALATQAADVNNSGSVNATDALLIVQRFAGVITTFAKGDWTFQQIPVTVGSTSLTAQVVKGLTVGDVNKSNSTTGASFAKSAVSDVVMNSDKSVGAASKAAFEIPMTSANAMTVGAVSLKINYPADQVTFTGVSSSKLSGVIAKAEDGVITIGWANMDVKSAGAELKENDVLLSLAFTAKNDKGTVTLTAGAGSQIADAAGNTISLAKLSANTVEVGTVPTEFELAQNYPNPFNPSTEIRYAVAQAGKVTLAIYNVMGQEVSRLVGGQQEAGVYKVRWNASGMASGVYIYRLQVDDKFTASKRLTLLK